ncbi:MAG: HAD hydrolase family protein [Candidatus Bathyarchaeia archaeon]
MKRVFISDCEGPISKNDNAFELTAHFVPEGDKLFTVISRYDDVLADVFKRVGYKAGDTLKLILPFLRAYDVTNQKMQMFSAESLILIASVKEAIQHIKALAHAFIVSTSYEHYIRALCKTIDFPFENVYCTKLDVDKYHIQEKEKAKLYGLAKEISQMPVIQIPPNAKSIEDFSMEEQKAIRRLDEIFWGEIALMRCGQIFSEVNPVGGREKAEAIKDAVRRVGTSLADVMYVGDSITDVEAFRLVRENGGLTVSFNGNQYAVKNAEIAILSENSIVTAIIAEVFCRFGKKPTLQLVENWSRETLKKSHVKENLLNRFFELYPKELPKVELVKSENVEALAVESSEFRKRVRGEAVGRLG